ncbi:C25 family cysteine peptidase [Fibrobacter sp. UWB12]|uniref:C25 family cysteine peptidase n=1 Tax=Fibrobacter sp. UWB12 TaxID=1896203 RepID=UPI00091F1150|nr:C25 family cysteine peptidase [Fibrobacter sp. UWB12]SHK59177.1 Peptidase family C25 [Fibrobacter sp. UWB12]
MNSIIKKFQILLVACATVSSLASSVVEDSKNRFVLDDEVLDSSKKSCEDGSGMRFVPENAFYVDSTNVPVRHYRVALPSSAKPSVSVTNTKLVSLGATPCKSTPVKIPSVDVSSPFFKDNLWMVDVFVPLYVKEGGSVALRKDFRLNVDFASAKVSGRNPGARALMLVENSRAAAQFGAGSVNRALRREATSDFDNIVQLAELVVGDENMATFSEDGLFAVSYSAIRTALLKVGRQDELDAVPVEKVCLFGAAPDTLPDIGPGAALRSPNRIFELPIKVSDRNSNGNFDEGDSLYFVGYGNAFWKRVDAEPTEVPEIPTSNMSYFHSYSPYSYYQHFVFGYKQTGKGLRLETLTAPKSSAKDVDWFRYVRAERDELLRDAYFGRGQDWDKATGKEYFWKWHDRGDTLVLSAEDLEFKSTTSDLPGFVSGGKGFVAVSFFPLRSQTNSTMFSDSTYKNRMKFISFKLSVNGSSYSKVRGEEIYWSDGDILPGGNFGVPTNALKAKDNKYELTIYDNSYQDDRFDGYSVAYQWDPSKVTVDSSEWILPGFSKGVIRIPVGKDSDLRLLKFKDFVPVGLLKISDGIAVDSIGNNEDVRYLLYRDSDRRQAFSVKGIPTPSKNSVQKLANISSKTEYLIITPEEFLAPAEALAEFRSSDASASKLVTAVVPVENIYRHYTGGALSPIAIRNYIAYARSVCPDLRFVLLAGSGHYDYRGTKHGKNYMPPFEKESAVTEDFFGVLDSGEVVRSGKAYDVDLAVGRVPVSSVQDFEYYNEKARDYDEIQRFDHGEWKSTLLLAADDAYNGVSPDPMDHTIYQENLANLVDTTAESLGFRMNIKKVYLLDYEADAAGQKQEAANDFLNILNQGALLTAYYGHGSKVAWATEGLMKLSYLSRITNKKRYTVLNSFSCTVGRFDEGNTRSMTEAFVLLPQAGAIAAIGAARETYANPNEIFAKNFVSRALLKNGNYLGVAYMQAKDNVFLHNKAVPTYTSNVFNSEHYVYMGEPVIRMPLADLKIVLDSPVDSIKALDKVKLSGKVSGMSSGNIALTLREGRYTKRLDMITTSNYADVKYDGPLIYSEIVPVVGGRFETEFVTPKKLNIGDTLAEFRAWAYSPNEVAIGRHFEKNIKITGVSNYADSLNDKTPPTIQIQLCNSGEKTSFVDNQRIKLQTPACLQVVVEDETALDYREQADEGITFEMYGLENPYHPTPFLEQASKRAVARKSLTTESYPPGFYTFMVHAMDVLGNVSVKTVHIEITENLQAGLADVFNVPNPMGKKGTTFYFKNLSSDSDPDVNIFIYNQHGRLVKVIKNAKSGETHWNGTDNFGRLLANGLYHYVVRSKTKISDPYNSTESKTKTKTQTWTKKQKLLISR